MATYRSGTKEKKTKYAEAWLYRMSGPAISDEARAPAYLALKFLAGAIPFVISMLISFNFYEDKAGAWLLGGLITSIVFIILVADSVRNYIYRSEEFWTHKNKIIRHELDRVRGLVPQNAAAQEQKERNILDLKSLLETARGPKNDKQREIFVTLLRKTKDWVWQKVFWEHLGGLVLTLCVAGLATLLWLMNWEGYSFWKSLWSVLSIFASMMSCTILFLWNKWDYSPERKQEMYRHLEGMLIDWHKKADQHNKDIEAGEAVYLHLRGENYHYEPTNPQDDPHIYEHLGENGLRLGEVYPKV